MRGTAVLLLDFLFFGIAARYRSKEHSVGKYIDYVRHTNQIMTTT